MSLCSINSCPINQPTINGCCPVRVIVTGIGYRIRVLADPRELEVRVNNNSILVSENGNCLTVPSAAPGCDQILEVSNENRCMPIPNNSNAMAVV